MKRVRTPIQWPVSRVYEPVMSLKLIMKRVRTPMQLPVCRVYEPVVRLLLRCIHLPKKKIFQKQKRGAGEMEGALLFIVENPI